jgi:hypothetical protein
MTIKITNWDEMLEKDVDYCITQYQQGLMSISEFCAKIHWLQVQEEKMQEAELLEIERNLE